VDRLGRWLDLTEAADRDLCVQLSVDQRDQLVERCVISAWLGFARLPLIGHGGMVAGRSGPSALSCGQYSDQVDAPVARRFARRDLALLALAAACWGLGTVVSKRAIDEMPPFVLFPIQLAASLVVLALLMRRAGVPLTGAPQRLGRLGLLNPGLAYALGLIGLTYISASLYVLLWALEPLLIVLAAGIFLGEGITKGLVLFSVIAAGGMGLVVYDPSTSGQWVGVLLVVAGVGCCAAYTVIARRWVGTSDSTAQVVLLQQVYALAFALALGVVAGVVGGVVRWSGISTTALFSAIGSGVLYYAAAYWFYLSALRRVPASLAATSFYLVPVFGVAASFVLLGERLTVAQWVGVGIVVMAVVAITRLPMGGVTATRRPATAVSR
jgi:probable blue pigment (indigoidine) exporter